MRSKLATALRKQFDDQLKREVPQFKNIKPEKVELFGKMEEAIPRGDRLYVWDSMDNLSFYLLLAIATSKMGDAFTIEFAYSTKTRFPATMPIKCLFDVPGSGIHRDTPEEGEFRFRIGEFIEPGKDHWWWLAPDIYAERLAELSVSKEFEKGFDGLSEMPIEEALSNVSPCVNEAIDIIKKCAIPYFREVESEHESRE